MAKKRIDIESEPQPLTDNPFAALGGSTAKPPKSKPAPPQSKHTSAPYQVERSRKGNWRIAIERRSGGKSVTILSGVTGDSEALLRELKKRCATGGSVRGDSIELQGDQSKSVEAYLNR